MKKINIGLIGAGTIGKGVVKILRTRKNMLKDKLGVDICLKKVCDISSNNLKSLHLPPEITTTDVQDIINNPQIDVIVELIGGLHPAKEYISASLNNGKYVVTANKALLAEFGAELFNLAKIKEKSIYFEASVGGGIPIIKSLREGLVSNKFQSIYGIVNGTSNYILSRMTKEKITFNEALKEAQKNGYAEKDPTLDIQGTDSAHKLAILGYLAFGKFIPQKEIFVEGISDISQDDITYAEEMNLTIKLLAIIKRQENELEVRVHPTLIPTQHLLSSINGVYNAIHVSSDLCGNMLFYGPGAGQLPTTSAVISDIADITKDIKAGLFRSLINITADTAISRLRKIDDIECRYYIRMMVIDKPGVLAKISGVLGAHNISIASMSQKERSHSEFVPIVMTTHEANERDMKMALEKINKLSIINSKIVAIRIEEL